MTKSKNTKSRTKKPKEQPTLYFENILSALLDALGQKVMVLRTRTGGAQEYGTDAMFVCATEALTVARQMKSIDNYVLAAAYTLVAALQLMNQWDTGLTPRPETPAPEKEEQK